MTRLLEYLGGTEHVREVSPLAYEALSTEDAAVEKNSGNRYNDDTFDAYMAIEHIYSDQNGIQSLIKVNMMDKSPFLAVVADVYDAKQKKCIDTFAYYYENVNQYEHRVISDSVIAKQAEKSDIMVKATFTWSEDGKTAKTRTVAYTASQHFGEEELIESLEVTHPRAKDKKQTVLAYNRTTQFSHDYCYNDGILTTTDKTKARFMLPFAGKLTVPSRFKIVGVCDSEERVPKLTIALSKGSNVVYSNPAGLKSLLEKGISEDRHSLSWSFMDKDALGHYPTDTEGKHAGKPVAPNVKDKDDWCAELDLSHFETSTVAELSCVFQLHLVDPDYPFVSFYPSVMINSTKKSTIKGKGVCEIEPIQIKWGCVAEDTMIAMADGTQRAAQDIRTGDMVRSGADVTSVLEIITGGEAEITTLTTYNGCTLRATESHPVSTTRGFIKMSKLDAADIIITESGESQVQYLFTEPYNSRVYSFILEHSGPLVCNSIIAGDYDMQNFVTATATQDSFMPSLSPSPLVLEMRKLFGLVNSKVEDA